MEGVGPGYRMMISSLSISRFKFITITNLGTCFGATARAPSSVRDSVRKLPLQDNL